MAATIYEELRRLTPKVTGGLVRMRAETFKDGEVPAKYKILAALAIVMVTKCEPCIKAYAKMAFDAGTAEKELLEFLNVAMTEGGCPGEQWAVKALKAFRAIGHGETFEEEACCEQIA